MMNNKHLLLVLVLTLVVSISKSATPTTAQIKQNSQTQLLEELTGRKAIAIKELSAMPIKNKVVANAKLHLNAGFQAFTKKDYILALKHYNTVIAKYPKAAEVRLTYLAKAKLYNEMGLAEQSQRNLKIAQSMTQSSTLIQK